MLLLNENCCTSNHYFACHNVSYKPAMVYMTNLDILNQSIVDVSTFRQEEAAPWTELMEEEQFLLLLMSENIQVSSSASAILFTTPEMSVMKLYGKPLITTREHFWLVKNSKACCDFPFLYVIEIKIW